MKYFEVNAKFNLGDIVRFIDEKELYAVISYVLSIEDGKTIIRYNLQEVPTELDKEIKEILNDNYQDHWLAVIEYAEEKELILVKTTRKLYDFVSKDDDDTVDYSNYTVNELLDRLNDFKQLRYLKGRKAILNELKSRGKRG